MSVFQWNDSHIDWFIQRFKGQSKSINAGVIGQNYHRRKGEPKLYVQDFRNLMRLLVQSGCARVVAGYFTSKRYEICLVSGEYPYTQIVFDEELFLFLKPADTAPDAQMCRALFPEISEQEWNNYKKEYLFMCCRAAALHDAFYVCNYYGGDLSTSALKELGADKESNRFADYFQLEIESFVLQYEALKAASPELKFCLLEDCPTASGLHLFEGYDSCFTFKHAHNYYFYKVVQANLIWDFWRRIGRPGKNDTRSLNTERKKWGEILSNPGAIHQPDASDYSQEFLDVRMFYSLVKDLPLIANRPEVIEAAKSWLIVLNELRSLEHSLSK